MTPSDHSRQQTGSASADPASQTLGELTRRFDLQLVAGDAETQITGMCSLENGAPGRLAYVDGKAHLRALQATAAEAVIVPATLADQAPGAALVAEHPQLAFAHIAALFDYQPAESGIHPCAVVHADAHIGEHVTIGPHAVVGAGCVIGDCTRIGANAVLEDHVQVGTGSYIGAGASIGHHVRMGARVQIAPNAVIGARGFGLVHDGKGWQTIPQLGAVVLGDDVEVGASSSIDRGALDDTVLGDDVRVDNQVQIGHNCRIGAHTVIAGSAGIAGSCRIGSNCMIAGGVGIGDHAHIADNVIITAASQVPRDINEPGVWSSTFRAMPAGQWRRLLARFRRLEGMNQRLKHLENKLEKHK